MIELLVFVQIVFIVLLAIRINQITKRINQMGRDTSHLVRYARMMSKNGNSSPLKPLSDSMEPDEILRSLESAGVQIGFLDDVMGVELIFKNGAAVDSKLKDLAKKHKSAIVKILKNEGISAEKLRN